MSRVQKLPPDLVNQIAAGEVVERPASVVKELAENSVDAGATRIVVQLFGGGATHLRVIDDGIGMSREDALMSLERHATSKLVDNEGLFRILTKGFRGEAIPAIASVSRFSMMTAEAGALVGTKIVVEGGSEAHVEDAPAITGTRIDVEDLFFNVPARRKFLKREATELLHCEDAVTRLALGHPEVGFRLEHEGRLLWSSPASISEPVARAAAVLGVEAAPHLLPIEERRLGVVVSGFVASPEFTLSNARGLMTFVNRRYVRDRGLTAAVQRAFQDSLPPGRQPVAAVFIDLDPAAVDVNVHPQKLEVRFSDPRSVQDAVGAAISRALQAAPWRTEKEVPATFEAAAQYAQVVDRFLSRAQSPPAFLESPAPLSLESSLGRASFGTARPSLDAAPPPGFFKTLRFIGVLAKQLWVLESKAGSLVVIDPKAVSERIALSALAIRYQSGRLSSAPRTLFSGHAELSAADSAKVLSAAPALLNVGVEVEGFGGTTVSVLRVPVELEAVEVTSWLVEVAEAPEDVKRLEVMARRVGDQASVAATNDEVHTRLSTLDDVVAQAHGRGRSVVLRDIPLLELK
jgi:DNA mismatch repair protein MutL